MRIDFKRIEMKNFMSFAEESFDISSCKGMSLVQGKNNDIPGSRNGCGKCVDPNTKIDVEMDEITYNAFIKMLSSSV